MTLPTDRAQLKSIAKRCDLFRLPVDLICENYLFSDELRLAFILGLLYKQGRMNKASYIASMKNLRDGKMLRTVKTYKCPVNKKFYNNEYILDIFIDVESEAVQPEEKRFLTFDEVIAILKMVDLPRKEVLYFGRPEHIESGNQKNNNYYIGQLWTDVIGTVYKHFNSNISKYSHKKLWSLGFLNSSFIEDDYDTSGYCCEDCDGPIENYNVYNQNGRNKANVKESLQFFLDGLNANRLIRRGYYTGPEVKDLTLEDL